MRLLVSFYSTEFERLRRRWRTESSGRIAPQRFADKQSGEGNIDKHTGLVLLFDWDSKKVCVQATFSASPTGIAKKGRSVLLCRYNSIVELDEEFSIQRVLSHRLMNDLHSIQVDGNKLIVSAAGLDAVLECNEDGDVERVWSAMDHGYNVDCFGNERSFDPQCDYRGVEFHTRRHCTHLNSCFLHGETIYATLFHQGEVLAIDRESGYIKKKLPGFVSPHAVRRLTADSLVVSNTRSGRVSILSLTLCVENEIGIDSTWIQDACPIGVGNTLVVSDNGNHCLRLIDVDSGTEVDRWEFDPNWRVFGAIEA